MAMKALRTYFIQEGLLDIEDTLEKDPVKSMEWLLHNTGEYVGYNIFEPFSKKHDINYMNDVYDISGNNVKVNGNMCLYEKVPEFINMDFSDTWKLHVEYPITSGSDIPYINGGQLSIKNCNLKEVKDLHCKVHRLVIGNKFEKFKNTSIDWDGDTELILNFEGSKVKDYNFLHDLVLLKGHMYDDIHIILHKTPLGRKFEKEIKADISNDDYETMKWNVTKIYNEMLLPIQLINRRSTVLVRFGKFYLEYIFDNRSGTVCTLFKDNRFVKDFLHIK